MSVWVTIPLPSWLAHKAHSENCQSPQNLDRTPKIMKSRTHRLHTLNIVLHILEPAWHKLSRSISSTTNGCSRSMNLGTCYIFTKRVRICLCRSPILSSCGTENFWPWLKIPEMVCHYRTPIGDKMKRVTRRGEWRTHPSPLLRDSRKP